MTCFLGYSWTHLTLLNYVGNTCTCTHTCLHFWVTKTIEFFCLFFSLFTFCFWGWLSNLGWLDPRSEQSLWKFEWHFEIVRKDTWLEIVCQDTLWRVGVSDCVRGCSPDACLSFNFELFRWLHFYVTSSSPKPSSLRIYMIQKYNLFLFLNFICMQFAFLMLDRKPNASESKSTSKPQLPGTETNFGRFSLKWQIQAGNTLRCRKV